MKTCHKCKLEIAKQELALCKSLNVNGCWVQAFECMECNGAYWTERRLKQLADDVQKADNVGRLREMWGEYGFLRSWVEYDKEAHDRALDIFKKRKHELQ